MSNNQFLDPQRRHDLEVIANAVVPGSKVLDLGCGDGLFLRKLKEQRDASVLGVEIDQDSIVRCIGNGVPVIQRDLNGDLDFLPDNSFDLAVLRVIFIYVVFTFFTCVSACCTFLSHCNQEIIIFISV